MQIAAKGLGEVLLANTIRVGSSSLRGGYHAGIEQLELLKHKALVYQVNKPGGDKPLSEHPSVIALIYALNSHSFQTSPAF